MRLPDGGHFLGLRHCQEIKRALYLGQFLLRQVQIEGGRGDAAMPQQQLDGAEIDAGFQEMRGETMAQRVQAVAAFQTGVTLGLFEDLLALVLSQGLGLGGIGE